MQFRLWSVMVGLGLFVAGAGWAMANTEMPMSGPQQQSSPMGMGAGQGPSASSPMGPAQGQGSPAVSQAEIQRFAAAVTRIKPLNEQIHHDLGAKSVSAAQRETLMKQYGAKVHAVLSAHHLTVQEYGALMNKAQTDPTFAQQVEAAIKAHP
jgi:hypothetical protein